ncbi:hypothetical protein M501DRAFT_1016338 [Patellaria atrata CBS 101060]|uniref:C2H2-type domain-containing protein n=1 Tax=Patellaria atrata CBS 101060 TaxID=1346257 RepID=A0A9P4SCD1_9PEZI|nr:hypothetical protein M501DRAFT_1016338 [Patellaria atrata CBS 101060]
MRHGISFNATPSIYSSIESQAIDRFFNEYAEIPGHSQPEYGYLWFLPALCCRVDVLPCLREALPAVALASLAKQTRQPRMLLRAHLHYGKALPLVNTTLSNPEDVKNDSTLVTVLLLGLYQLITAEKDWNKMWDSHHSGRELMIKLRGPDLLRTNEGRGLFRFLQTQLSIGYLLKRKRPPPETTAWLSLLPKDSSVTRLLRMITNLGHFRIDVNEFLSLRPEDQEEGRFNELIEAGSSLEDELGMWRYKVVASATGRLLEDRGNYCSWTKYKNRKVIVHMDIFRAITWNHYRCIRIRLLECLLELCQHQKITVESPFGKLQVIWKNAILELADDICASVPYLFGCIDQNGNPQATPTGTALSGYTLLWPLRAAVTVEGISLEHKIYIREQYEYIGNVFGIGQAHVIARLYGLDSLEVAPMKPIFDRSKLPCYPMRTPTPPDPSLSQLTTTQAPPTTSKLDSSSESPPSLYHSPVERQGQESPVDTDTSPATTAAASPLFGSPKKEKPLYFSWHRKLHHYNYTELPDSDLSFLDSGDFDLFSKYTPPSLAMATQSASPIDITTPQRYNSASPRNQTSNLTSALQEAGATVQQQAAININSRTPADGRPSLGGRHDSISNQNPSSYYGSGARPITMKERPRRESSTGSVMGGMSWGGLSMGSWVANEVIMGGSSPHAFHQSSSYQSSSYLPKMEAQFLQGYACCDLKIDSLHDLLQHYEEAHAQTPAPALHSLRRPSSGTNQPPRSNSIVPQSSSTSGNQTGNTQQPQSMGLQGSSRQGQNSQLSRMQTYTAQRLPSDAGFSQTPLSPIQDSDPLDDMDMEMDDAAPPVPVQQQNNTRIPPLNVGVANAIQSHQGLRNATPTTPSANQGFPLQNNPTVSSVNTPTLGTQSAQYTQNKSSPDSSVPGTPAELDFDMAGNYVGGGNFNAQLLQGGNNQDWNSILFGNSGDMANLTIDDPAKRLFSKQGGAMSTQQLQFALAQGQIGGNGELARRIREQQLMAGLGSNIGPFPIEENKPFKCPVIGCEKAYKNQNGLKYHKQHGHQNQQLKENSDGTFSIVDPVTSIPYPGTVGMEKEKPYRCEVCGKRYKNLNGLKYHRQHSANCNPELKLSALGPTNLQGINVNVAGAGLSGMGDAMMM